jgi:3,4-dihydroxy-2-butanone 4-phosphate synthase
MTNEPRIVPVTICELSLDLVSESAPVIARPSGRDQREDLVTDHPKVSFNDVNTMRSGSGSRGTVCVAVDDHDDSGLHTEKTNLMAMALLPRSNIH